MYVCIDYNSSVYIKNPTNSKVSHTYSNKTIRYGIFLLVNFFIYQQRKIYKVVSVPFPAKGKWELKISKLITKLKLDSS